MQPYFRGKRELCEEDEFCIPKFFIRKFRLQKDYRYLCDHPLRASDTVTRIKRFILENIDRDLTLNRLSELVRVNPSYLSRLFKQETGSNITEYIFEMRIEKSKELLRSNSKKIHEISVAVGYESPNSFARFFKNTVGVYPQEYRDSFQQSR